MIGQDLFTKSDKRLQVIMGTKKVCCGLHIIVFGDFYQLPPVMDSFIFKDDPHNYGPLATNLLTTYFQIFHGLLWELPAAINLLYTLMINIKTNDQLINDASCTLKKMQYL